MRLRAADGFPSRRNQFPPLVAPLLGVRVVDYVNPMLRCAIAFRSLRRYDFLAIQYDESRRRPSMRSA